MKNGLIALLLSVVWHIAPAAGTPPTISGAVLSGGVLSITGSNFGSKSPAAPLFYESYESYSQNWQAVPNSLGGAVGTGVPGLAHAGGREYPFYSNGATPYVDTTRAFSGSKSLRWDARDVGDNPNESFPRIGVRDIHATTLYQSYWRYVDRTAGTIGFHVDKFLRAGNYGTDDWYNGHPKLYGSDGDIGYDNSANTNSGNIHPSSAGLSIGQWDFIEMEYVLSPTAGVAHIAVNNTDAVNVTGANTSDGTDFIEGAFVAQGVDFYSPQAFSIYLDATYIDTTRARVAIGNASTKAACGGFFVVPPTVWLTGITATASNIPTGFNWVYVTNAGGETNSSGFAYTGGSPPSSPAFSRKNTRSGYQLGKRHAL